MKLADYFKTPGAQAALAKKTKIHAPLLSVWASFKRETPIDRCTLLERETDGAVKRWDLRPHDWYLHWPELVGADGAPEVAAEAGEGA